MSYLQRSSPPPQVITQNDVETARLQSERSNARYDGAVAKLSGIVNRQQQLSREVRINGWIEKARRTGDQTMTRIGVFINLLFLPSALVLVVCSILSLHSSVRALAVLIAASGMGFLGSKLFKPSDEKLKADLLEAGNQLAHLAEEKRRSEEAVRKTAVAFENDLSIYQGILGQFQSRINQLRSVEWRHLQAVPFEDFLAEVFREWGYLVETTKVTGDQGVDLIVTKNGVRTAIQAKGYLSSTVGNDAIQQAFTGMKIYNCQQCAVITNSTFTSSARQAAAAVGCVLIDGEKLPLLINGQFMI